MNTKTYMIFGIITAAIAFWVVHPLLGSTLKSEAPFAIKLVLLAMFSIPVWGSLIVVPVAIAAFMAITNKAEDATIKFIRKNK